MNMEKRASKEDEGFFSILHGFNRYLICSKCGWEAPLWCVFNNPLYSFSWSGFEFHAKCPRCKTEGVWRHSDRKNDKVRVKRWNPQEIEVLLDQYTNTTRYIWKIPEDIRRYIREGKLFHLERANWEIIQAVKHNNHFMFDKDVVRQGSRPSLNERMNVEKRAIIEEGRTPPEETTPGEKRAQPLDLEDHVTRRLAERVRETPTPDSLPRK